MMNELSDPERRGLLKLGRHGASATFDHVAMSRLFAKGLIEIRDVDHRLVLTAAGREIYDHLTSHRSQRL